MLPLMLVIWNCIFGHKGEAERGQYCLMRNCNLCQCVWACCPDTEKNVQTLYWEGGNVKHQCINWKIVPK